MKVYTLFSFRFTLAFLLAMVLGAGTFMIGDSPPSVEAAFPGANGKIALTSNRDGLDDIHVMNDDGSGRVNITNSPGSQEGAPDWSPDGTKIAFFSNLSGTFEVHEMYADGSGQINLTNNPASFDGGARYSPDGTRIVFQSDRDGNNEIYIMNADGSGQTNLTSNPASDTLAAWSPDGTKIAFTSNRDGNDEIYLMNPDGTGQTRQTNNPANDGHPAWSPDGTMIAFSSTRLHVNGDVFKMNADGTGQTPLTNLSSADGRPDWSPDGTMILFDSNRDDNNGDNFVMNTDGSGQTNLTPGSPSFEFAPDWQSISGSVPWESYQNDNKNSGRTDVTGPAVPQVDWTTLLDEFSSVPGFSIGSDGSIYLPGTNPQSMYSFSQTGVRNWKTVLNASGQPSQTAIGADSTPYIGTQFVNKVHGFNPTTGAVSCEFQGSGWQQHGPTIGPDGTVYMGGWGGFLYALNPDCSLKWSRSLTGGGQPASMAALADDGTVYTGVGNFSTFQGIRALNPDGTDKWSINLGVCSSTPVVRPDGVILYACGGDKLHAVSPAGVKLWDRPVAGVWGTPAVGADNTAYIATLNSVDAIDANGNLLWSYLPGTSTGNTPPIIDGAGTIYAPVSGTGSIHALNPNGTLKWTVSVGGGIVYMAIGADGRIYSTVNATTGTLVAIGEATQSNQAPVANNDSYNATEDTPFNVAALGVLANDTDVDMDGLTAVLDTPTSNGTLTLNPDGSFNYSPIANFCGQDSFTYHANDSELDSNIATVTIDVVCVNDLPVITVVNPTVTVNEGQTATNGGTISDIDSDVNLITFAASKGAAVNDGDGTWSWSFNSSDGPSESGTVTITADDGTDTSQVTFGLTVNNVAPTATLTASPSTVGKGTPSVLSFSNQFDPSPVDTIAGFLYSYDCEGDSILEVIDTLVSSHACIYSSEGVFTAVGRIKDKDGGFNDLLAVVTVIDLTPPEITASLVPLGNGDDDDDDDEGRFRVEFSATDNCDPSPSTTAELLVQGLSNPITVLNGQIIEFENDDEDTEVEFEDGVLEIEAPALTLRVTATDLSGNTSIVEVEPTGLSPDNDSESEDDD